MRYDVDQGKLINAVAEELKKNPEIKPPEWAKFVKTGAFKERPPTQKDWWYRRVASILRTVMVKGPVGTEKLRVRYGGKKNRGMRPEEFRKGSGSIARKALQQLESAGFVKKEDKSVKKGRVITGKGIKLFSECAKKIK